MSGIGPIFERLILHIGAHKTGTTSIQQSLTGNPDLAAAGVYMPTDRGRLLGHFTQNIGRIYPGLAAQNPPDALRGQCTAAFEALAAAAAAPAFDQALFSCEELLFLPLADIAAMAAKLRPLAAQIEVVYYVRHPKARLPSLLSEMIKSRWATLDTDLAPLIENYAGIFAPWTAAFGADALRVRPFRGPDGTADPVEEFCAAIGVPELAKRLPPRRLNRGLSAPAVAIKSALNATGRIKTHNPRLVRALEAIDGPKFALPAARLRPLEPEIARQLAWLAAHHNVRPAPPPERPDPDAPTFNEAALQSLGALLLDQSEEEARLKARVKTLRARLDGQTR
ncbi:MAG: hypothetical protein AAF281_06645 [Pseudomonadota bacterium]